MKHNKRTIIAEIQSLKPDITHRFHGDIIGIFGSYARDEATDKSDLDILVKFYDNATLIDLVGMSQYLETKLNCKVDVLSENAVRQEIKPTILNDLIAL
ncbi:MAG: nucleotidyltransferase family protein [Candidatus Marinimicrobia bacterium]|nr:nucleotidyltransferase family protein [Candidatus Neomarinimicrobiota bacterium]